MRRNLLALVLTGLLLGVVIAGTASAAAIEDGPSQVIDDRQSQVLGADGTFVFETNNTTAGANETDGANETVEGGETNETVGTNETEPVGPGTYLSGAVGAHRAELEGAVTERAFGLSIAAAVSNGSKAGLVANRTERLETRLQELEQTREELEAAYENGSIQNGTYQVRLTTLSARISATEQMINRTIVESSRLPHDVRQAHGVNQTRLDSLRTHARNLTGPEVAAIARTIGGPMTGMPAGERGPPAHAGPGGSMGPPDTVTGTNSNTTHGSPTNTTHDPPANRTDGQSTNRTAGPPNTGSVGPSVDTPKGPSGDGTMGPPEERGRNTRTNRSGR